MLQLNGANISLLARTCTLNQQRPSHMALLQSVLVYTSRQLPDMAIKDILTDFLRLTSKAKLPAGKINAESNKHPEEVVIAE